MSDSVIGEWNLHSTDAGACASAVFLPAVRTRQQSKSLAAEDNQVTDNRKRMHGFSVPKPRLFESFGEIFQRCRQEGQVISSHRN